MFAEHVSSLLRWQFRVYYWTLLMKFFSPFILGETNREERFSSNIQKSDRKIDPSWFFLLQFEPIWGELSDVCDGELRVAAGRLTSEHTLNLSHSWNWALVVLLWAEFERHHVKENEMVFALSNILHLLPTQIYRALFSDGKGKLALINLGSLI